MSLRLSGFGNKCATVEAQMSKFPKDHLGRPESGRFKEMFVYASDEPGPLGWPVAIYNASGGLHQEKFYAEPYAAYKAAQRALEKLWERGDTSWEVVLG